MSSDSADSCPSHSTPDQLSFPPRQSLSPLGSDSPFAPVPTACITDRSDADRNTQAHRHTHLTALFPGLPGSSGTRKVKPIWILLKQETASGNGLSWETCKSAPRSRQITTPAPYHSVFYRPDALPFRTTNSVKALSRCIAGLNLNRNSFISSSRSAVQYTTIIINNATTTGMYGQRHLTSSGKKYMEHIKNVS